MGRRAGGGFVVGEMAAPAFFIRFSREWSARIGRWKATRIGRETRRMAREIPQVGAELESRVEELGYELVDVEWAGSRSRPLLRIRIDLPGEAYGAGQIGVDDCAAVSRSLEAWLDELDAFPERYVLEVSTPGVERPLRRSRDFRHFVGERVAVKGPGELAGRATRLEGELLGIDEEAPGGGDVRLRLDDGEEVRIRRDELSGAHLLFEWE